MICENGAIIYDNKDNILYSCYLEQDDIDSTIEIIKKYNLKFIIDTGDKYITDLNQKFSNVASIFLDRKTINDVNEMLKIGGGKVAPFFLFNFVAVLSNSSYIPYAGNFLINI